MYAIHDRLIFSATDLGNFLACGHLSLLSRRAALGGPKPPKYEDPSLEVLWLRGLEHEQRHLERLRADGGRVVEIAEPDDPTLALHDRWTAAAAAATEAMRRGADVIYQAVLFDGTWLGKADFLVRVDVPSALGAWSYEVVDTKLAREAKGGALLQVLLYADLLAGVQGVACERVHIALGGPAARTETFRVADYAAYFRSIRRRFRELVQHSPLELPLAVEPVGHCDICAWSTTCDAERRGVDHLAFVAGISAHQRRVLGERGVATLAALATLPAAAPAIDGIGGAALTRIREQARIQLDGRRTQRHVHELLLPVTPGEGLAKLPPPSPGDLFFDLEGDPFALTHGLEYLFGFVDRDGEYTVWWALDRAAERAVFERFIDFVMQRLERHPDLHIYHYNHYETTALKRLMGRYGTREDEVDRLLRGGVFVDLYRVVRQGLRASVESYSIKKLEPFYGYERDVDLRSATHALAHFEAWLELGGARDDALLARIQGYNRDDCVSTLRLNEWLESLRLEAAAVTGHEPPRPEPVSGDPSDERAARDAAIEALVARLTSDLPLDENARDAEQQGRWLAAQLLDFHRREKKAFWWEYFRCLDLSDDELIEDRATLGGLEYDGEDGIVARSVLYRYRFPRQEHSLRADSGAVDPVTQKSAGTIVDIDDATSTLVLKRSRSSKAPHPRALVPKEDIKDRVLRESLQRVGEATAAHGLSDAHPYRAAADLLAQHPPRVGQAPGEDLMRPGESTLAAAIRLVGALDRTVLPIQGPPGAGKTFTAARMIVAALRLGRRVGVTAQSHKVIGNLLEQVSEAAAADGLVIRGMQKCKPEEKCRAPGIVDSDDNQTVRDALRSGEISLAGGTAWLWSRDDMIGAVDLLVIDEAGQFSLANALAVAPATSSLVLVGDPQQLEQPMQGVHPPGVNVSALDHLLGGATTVPSDRGLFLDRTWRLHPDICAFTSEIFYDGRLQPRAGLERQVIESSRALGGSGLRFVPVTHTGNQSESIEEADAVARLITELLDSGAAWVDAAGTRQGIGIGDILVVAPYNAHVAALAARLPPGARVGTVDKFQGREAPIVIYSMATSSPAEAPRGMAFLYSPNRLNVATSRARCLAVVVASPALFTPDCRTPEQMRLANAFCRFVEIASPWPQEAET
jgi:predicted RecB family nuclease